MTTPNLEEVQARMQPGVITLHGFLGHDPRPLAEILAEDNMTVAKHMVTHQQIASALRRLADAARNDLEREVLVEGRYRVTVRNDRGLLPSPWGDGLFEKGEMVVIDPTTGHTFRFNALSLHMIEAHGFYGGRGSPYRLDPLALLEALDLQPLGTTITDLRKH